MSEIAPILLSIIVCDRIILDRMTGQASIIGIVSTISAVKYPARHPQAVFFCELTNGHGRTKIITRLVDVSKDDHVLWEQSSAVMFQNVKQVINLVVVVNGLTFPHPGEYRLQVEVAGDILGERCILCTKIKKPTGGQKDGK